MCQLSKSSAEEFYAVHRGKPFYEALTSFMSSGPVVALELMAASGIRKWRDLLGEYALVRLHLQCSTTVVLQRCQAAAAIHAATCLLVCNCVAGQPRRGILRHVAASGPTSLLPPLSPAGPTDSNAARQQAPSSIRALFGTDGTCNAAHGSDSLQNAATELAFFFGAQKPGSSSGSRCGSNSVGRYARCQNTTLGVIKPHAVKDGLAGMIVDCIQEVFDVTGLQMFHLDKPAVAEFLEVSVLFNSQ